MYISNLNRKIAMWIADEHQDDNVKSRTEKQNGMIDKMLCNGMQ